jgi:hypothetical protein
VQVCAPVHAAHVAPNAPQNCGFAELLQRPSASFGTQQPVVQVSPHDPSGLAHLPFAEQDDAPPPPPPDPPPVPPPVAEPAPQTPPEQTCPPVHASHSAPRAPHAVFDEPARQVPSAAQQPEEHDAALHELPPHDVFRTTTAPATRASTTSARTFMPHTLSRLRRLANDGEKRGSRYGQ